MRAHRSLRAFKRKPLKMGNQIHIKRHHPNPKKSYLTRPPERPSATRQEMAKNLILPMKKLHGGTPISAAKMVESQSNAK